MIVSEDEARMVRCPLAYGAPFTSPNGAEVISIDLAMRAATAMTAPVFCIGSKCMAWRWRAVSHRKGYCGMAGPGISE